MADAKKARITLVKSAIGYNQKQKDTVRALGLNKINATREVTLTPHMQGMINKVSHLLLIEDAS
ncbi:MAG: 50S ribosomal protein L30 [Phototrophicaceae bacterium]